MGKSRYLIVVILIILILSPFVGSRISRGNLKIGELPKIHLELFVMSQCPFAVSAEKEIISLIDIFGEEIDFKLNFIASDTQYAKEQVDQTDGSPDNRDEFEEYEDYGAERCGGVLMMDTNSRFHSLHGQSEIEEDIRQLVIMKYYPERFPDYLLLRGENYDTDDWSTPAAEASLDIDHIKELVEGPEGERLLEENIKCARALNVDSSPMLFINGKLYKGRIEKNSLGRYICKHMAAQHKACKGIPICGNDQDCDNGDKVGLCLEPDTKNARCICDSPRRIMLTIIREKGVKEKKDDNILLASKAMFPKLSIREIRYNSQESKALINKYGIAVLPAYILDKNIEKEIRFIRIKETLLRKDDAYIINPSCLPKAYLINRKENKGQLDIFVESLSESHNYLEYTIRTDPFLGKLPLKIHFFVDKTMKPEYQDGLHPQFNIAAENDNRHAETQIYYKEFASARGEKEIQEDIRQLCISEKYPEKYKAYLACLNKNILEGQLENPWKLCVREAEIDSQIISSEHMKGRGVDLLLKDIALTDELQVEASPAILINNNILLRDFTLEMIKELI